MSDDSNFGDCIQSYQPPGGGQIFNSWRVNNYFSQQTINIITYKS